MISGGEGSDIIKAGDGNDFVEFSSLAQIIDGGNSVDTLNVIGSGDLIIDLSINDILVSNSSIPNLQSYLSSSPEIVGTYREPSLDKKGAVTDNGTLHEVHSLNENQFGSHSSGNYVISGSADKGYILRPVELDTTTALQMIFY